MDFEYEAIEPPPHVPRAPILAPGDFTFCG
jgi:hypothetical protein